MSLNNVIVAACGAIVFLSACTTTEKVTVRQGADKDLTCDQLLSEFTAMDAIMKDVANDQGANVANTVSAITLPWFAIGNYLNAKEAEDRVQKRREHLMVYYNQKNCDD